jgi:hypothetical protein
MTTMPQLAADAETRAGATDHGLAAAQADLFVINLCSSTTPMALTQPDAPELKRFRFFVSRRLEDRRERFRLHMGYFASLDEAEEWLSVVRDVYPGAWAGEAPGKRLRARAAAAALPGAPPAQARTASQELAADAAAPPATLAPAPSASMIAHRTDVAASVASSLAPPPAPAVSTIVPPAQVAASAAPAATPPPARVIQKPTDAVVLARAPSAAVPLAEALKKSKDVAATVAASPARPAPRAPLSNVREVLAALDETEVKVAVPPPNGARRTQTLSDTQVMTILEERGSQERARGENQEANSNIPMLRPDDTGTLRALREAVQNNAAVAFAVQLQWSVQPMELDKVPPLAIFSAYTLYSVEGSHEGRKWYGLRLGFFSDAAAAKQVAHYVRSEFTTVAVLPVSAQERRRATEADQKSERASFKETSPAADAPEIELLTEASVDLERRSPASPMRGAAKLATAGAHTATPAARAAAHRSKKLRSKERTAERKTPCSLEETLEILGAGDLEIDNGRGELINESAVRHLSVEVRKDSPFARLVARLTERVRRS